MEEQIVQLVQELAAALEKLSPQVWEILVYQARLEGLSSLIWSIVNLFLFFLCLRIAFRYTIPVVTSINTKENLAYREDEKRDGYRIMTVLLFMAAVVVLLISILQLLDAVRHYLNPEFYAISYLLEQINSK